MWTIRANYWPYHTATTLQHKSIVLMLASRLERVSCNDDTWEQKRVYVNPDTWYFFTLPMLRLLPSKVQGCKDFRKSSKPCHVGMQWKAFDENYQMSSAGTRPRKLTRALGKSHDQNSSPYRVLRPHWQDLKANDLKQHCASVYTGTCQAHIKVYRGSVNRWTRKWRSTHLTRRLEENTFYYWKCGANLGVLAIARPHMHRTHVLL